MSCVLEFGDDGTLMRIEVDPICGLVHITEGYNTDFPVSIVVTAEGLASIGEAVAQYLETEES